MKIRTYAYMTMATILSLAHASPIGQAVDHNDITSQRLAFLGGFEPAEANIFEIAIEAFTRSTTRDGQGRRRMSPDVTLSNLGRLGKRDMASVCTRGAKGTPRRTTKVTHYYVPLLKSFNKQTCHNMEGVCRFWKNGEEWIANYGHPSIPLREAWCKNGKGYGLTENCTHPCRSLAADPDYHRGGEIIFFPELVGMKCGTGKNAMIHDGFMIVNDTGANKHFNHEGRFDFFWGECREKRDGICRDPGAIQISQKLSRSTYCRAWRPADPLANADIKLAFSNAVRTEAIARGDGNAAISFDMDAWTARSHAAAGQKFKEKRRLFAQGERGKRRSQVASR